MGRSRVSLPWLCLRIVIPLILHFLHLCASASLDLSNRKGDLFSKTIGKALMGWHRALFLKDF